MKAAIDTNLLAYAEGLNGTALQQATIDLIERIPVGSAVLPVQVLGELFRVLVMKGRWAPETARSALLSWREGYRLIATTPDVMLTAAELATDHRLGIWDAVVLAAAAEAGCRVLLSEDMQNGFTWNGVTVVNPLLASPHPLLTTLLDGSC